MINLTNTGTIRSLNSFSSTTPAQSEGVTTGGGLIKGQSDSAIAVGGAASGFSVTINNNAGSSSMARTGSQPTVRCS